MVYYTSLILSTTCLISLSSKILLSDEWNLSTKAYTHRNTIQLGLLLGWGAVGMGEHCIYIGLWTGSMDVRLTLLNQNNNRWFKKVKRVRECQKLPSYCVTALGTAWNLWQIFKWVIGRKLCKLHLAQSLRLPGLRHNFQLTKIFFFHGQSPTLSLQPLARGITCRIIPTFWGKKWMVN